MKHQYMAFGLNCWGRGNTPAAAINQWEGQTKTTWDVETDTTVIAIPVGGRPTGNGIHYVPADQDHDIDSCDICYTELTEEEISNG